MLCRKNRRREVLVGEKKKREGAKNGSWSVQRAYPGVDQKVQGFGRQLVFQSGAERGSRPGRW